LNGIASVESGLAIVSQALAQNCGINICISCNACTHEQGLLIVPYYHPLLDSEIFDAPNSACTIAASPDSKLVGDGF